MCCEHYWNNNSIESIFTVIIVKFKNRHTPIIVLRELHLDGYCDLI